MKKILPVLIVVMLLVTAITPAVFAATLDDVISALEDANVPEAYIERARSYFTENELTDDEAAALIERIEAASAIADGQTKLSDLTESQRNAILAEVVDAATAIGLTASYDDGSLIIRDESGEIVFSESFEGAVKQTGHDYSLILYGLAGLALAGGTGLVVKKKISQPAS